MGGCILKWIEQVAAAIAQRDASFYAQRFGIGEERPFQMELTAKL